MVMCIFGVMRADFEFYGNEVEQRSGIVSSDLAEPGARMWIDDPLNGESYPDWGFLSYYRVYIDARAPELSPIQLQIWTSVVNRLRRYTLKASFPLQNYQPGRLHTIAAALNSRGFPIEITSGDRLGFTHTSASIPVSFNAEVEDTETATTAHRTYYFRLERNNNSLPKVGETYRFSNDALRGKFSVGVILSNAPPQASSELYIGADLRSSAWTLDTSKVVILKGYKLRKGQLTGLFMRFNATSDQVVTMDLLLWKSSTVVNRCALIYSQRFNASINVTDPYTKVALQNGPKVDESTLLGFRTVNANSSLCFRVLSRADNYYLVDSDQQLKTGQDYMVDKLRQYYEFSIGVTVDIESIG